jgi:hypothetical protein
VVIPRFGVVLGSNGGMLAQLLPLFKLGLGGKLGSGRQWLSWIHLHDHLHGLLFLAEKKNIRGVVNLTSPNPVTNKQFTKELGSVLKKPTLFRVPKTALRLALGETSNVVLQGQKVMPEVLLKEGFQFNHPYLDEALKDILTS